MKKLILPLIAVCLCGILQAQTWNGSISNNWNTPGNWTGGLPGAGSNVTIPGALAVYPVLNSNVTINGIFMNSGSRLDVNGYTLTLNGTTVFTNFTGAILNNSNVATDIVLNINTGGSGYNTQFNSNTVNDAIIFNLTGTNTFYEGNVAPANQFTGNATFNIGATQTVYISNVSAAQYGANLTVSRTVGGDTWMFAAGATIAGNYAFTNNFGGGIGIGNVTNKINIGGTINLACNYPAPASFDMYNITNQTTGGVINIQNSRGMFLQKDTLKVASLSVTGYRGSEQAYVFNNSIAGNVTFADDVSFGSGYTTQFRSNVFTGTTTISNNGFNPLYEANAANTSNRFIGNTTFNCNGSGAVYISHGDTSQYDGNLIINRTASGHSQAFNSGGIVNGNLSYTNNTAGNTYFGNNTIKTTISGTVNMAANLTAVNEFQIHRLINQTNGGSINIQNSNGYLIEKDTLKVVSLSVTGYRGTSNYASLLNNTIEGNVTLTADATYAGGYGSYVRSNVITGNINFTNNSPNEFYEADLAGTGNYIGGNATFTSASSGNFVVSHLDTSAFGGNVIFTRTVAGYTQMFNSGGIVGGNFTYTGNNLGDTYFGNVTKKTSIAGTVNITANYTVAARFEIFRLINQTGGGTISAQNSRGFRIFNDTLLVNSVSVTGYRGTQYADMSYNNISGNVSITADTSYGSGYGTYLRSNVIGGSVNVTNYGFNEINEADVAGTGNSYAGNVTFNCSSTGALYLSHGDTSQFNGNLTINRTLAGHTQAFNSGGIIGGSLSYTNNSAGNSYFGNNAIKTSIGGMVNMSANLTAVNDFEIHRLINQTNGGSINIKNSKGFIIEKDTLKVTILSVTAYRGSQYGSLLNNTIDGQVTLTADTTYGGGYGSYIRSNVITGNINFTNLSVNEFYEADVAGSGNYFGGSATFNAISSGNFVVSHLDTSTFVGNVIFNRTVAGYTQMFNGGGILSGNFSFTGNNLGDTYFGNVAKKTSISGTVNIIANYTANARFEMHRLINQTGGGTINVQNSRGFIIQRDTLLVNSLIVNGYRGAQYGYLLNNDITGDVTTADDASYGGGYGTYLRSNIITGNSSFACNGTNAFGDADGAGDGNKYIGNVSYTRTASTLNVGFGDTTEISGNLTLNSVANLNLSKLRFNLATNGVIEQLGTQPIEMSLLMMSKTGTGKITLADSVAVAGNANFSGGLIYSSAGNNLIFNNNATQTGASVASHVVGPVAKIGDDVFTFPVGSPNSLNIVGISAPVGATSKFRAEYKNQNPSVDGYNTNLKVPSLSANAISKAGYWDVQRLSGATNVTLTLGFGTNPYETYPTPLTGLKVVHWAGTQWEDHGSAAPTGTPASGTINNSVAITSFSPFTLAGVIPTYFYTYSTPGPGPDGTPVKFGLIGGFAPDSIKQLPGGTYTTDSIFLIANGSSVGFKGKDFYNVEKDDTTVTVPAAPLTYISANGNGTVNFTGWRHFVYMRNGSNQIMGAIKDSGLTLGNTIMNTYFSTGNVATSPNGNIYLKRSFKITSQFAPAGAKRVVRFYITKTEFNNLVAADPTAFPSGINSLTITKYTGPMEDSLFNPQPGGNAVIIPNSAITIVDMGTMYSLDIAVDGFSGFYIGGNNMNLNLCSGSTITLSSNISGASYQWQVDNGGGFANVTNGGIYSGATTGSLTITNPPNTIYGYKYRALVNGVTPSQVYTIKLNISWTGAVSTAWENVANWSCGALPNNNTDVIINAGKPNFPQLNSNVNIRSLRVNPGATVTIKTGFNLTVNK
ncbi:MAG: hypothetical protein V4722_00780 [Bacteroidota bacterium]